MYGKFVNTELLIGGEVLALDPWGSVTVRGTDGNEYEIRAERGYSGIELNAYETASSVATRGAATKREQQ